MIATATEYEKAQEELRALEERLGRLKEKAQGFEMQAKGRKQYVEQLMRGCLAPKVLRLKKGAEVMFVKNDQAGSYVNGTQGIVVGFAPDKAPVVRTRAGKGSQLWQSAEIKLGEFFRQASAAIG